MNLELGHVVCGGKSGGWIYSHGPGKGSPCIDEFFRSSMKREGRNNLASYVNSSVGSRSVSGGRA